MIGKKINQLATELAPESTDLTIIGDPTTGVSKKITIAQLGAIFSGAVSFYTNLAAFPVTGDINVIYCAKDTQKLYLWTGSAYVEVFPSQALLDTYQLRSEKGNANGYASLDSLGKVPISQLPSSIMEYKGTWNAATNTPTLANGTGDTGDVYICNVAGTVNFGAGPITFAVGDYVIYSGTIWQRSSGAVGTVTSVAASITGNSVSISNSPIVTSGTLAFAFAGNATQYVRGDGQLATLPTNGGGGGASVSYYLNGSINQGTIGGVTYYEMNKTPIIGAGTDFTRNSNGYIASFLTDANDPALLNIPAGNFNFETYFEASSGGGSPTFYIELYKYDGTNFTLIASNSTSPKLINDATNIEAYFSALAVPQTTLTLTDRLAIRIYVTTAGRTITLHTENNTLCQVITTFTTGLTALNGLTSQVQYLATGTSGTDFNIASASATHTFNLPTASATNRGALSSADWTTFNNKQNSLTLTTTGTSGAATLIGSTLNIPQYTDQFVGTVTNVSALTLGTTGTDLSSTVTNSTTTPVITLNVPTASATNRGALSSTDWTTFNNKQNALTNPITGISASGRVAYFNGDTSITGSSNFFWDATNNRLGIGLNNPQRTLEIFNATADSQLRISGAAPSVSLGEAITGAIYQAKFGLITANGQYVTGGVAGDFVMISQTGATIFATSSTEKMRVQASGNVSIGNTNDTFRLDVTGTLRATGAVTFSSSVTATNLSINTTTSDGRIDVRPNGVSSFPIFWRNNNGGYGGGIYVTGGNSMQMYLTNSAGTENVLIAATGTSYFNGGNVGIGTTNPNRITEIVASSGAVLGVSTTANGSGLLYGRIAMYSTAGSNSFIDYGGEIRSYSGAGIDNSDLRFYTANAAPSVERMRITNGGNVGIGTNNPTERLHINNSSTNAAFIRFQNTGGDGVYVGGRNNDLELYSGGSLKAIILSGGNVGIGTSNPTLGKLQVENSGSDALVNINNTTTNGSALYLTVNTSGSLISSGRILQDNSGNMRFNTGTSSDTERMRITSGGSVLINRTSDINSVFKLQVEGRTLINSNQYALLLTQNAGASGMYLGADTQSSNTNLLFTSGTTGGSLASINGANGVYTALSDINKKKDFELSNLGLDVVMGLKPTLYRIKDEYNTAKHLGFIAQEVKDFIPQAFVNNNGFIGLDYQAITATLVKAIQELKQELDTLKNK